jgi:hypothetical protein
MEGNFVLQIAVSQRRNVKIGEGGGMYVPKQPKMTKENMSHPFYCQNSIENMSTTIIVVPVVS